MKKIHFEVQVKQGERADYLNSVQNPTQYPCYILVFNDNWNDYGCYTWFCLYRFQSEQEKKFIGELKLMHHDIRNTYDTLEMQFDAPLDEGYCSLGIDIRYYEKMCDVINDESERKSVLYYLRDCAWDSKIYESFANDEIFNTSLLREMSSERARREGKFIIAKTDQRKAYSFSYKFCPQKDVEALWNVQLNYKSPSFMRCIGVIGENGIGKTRMLSGMVRELISSTKPLSKTLFSSCLVLSSTPLDKYPSPDLKKNRIPYVVYSLEQDKSETAQHLTSTLKRVLKRPQIDKKELSVILCEKLKNYIKNSDVDVFIKDEKDNWIVNEERIKEIVELLSSGELHILLLLSHIYANIHFSSLLVIDEPEVHLHPRMIKDFVIMLCEVLRDFESFAIIATHSPLIVREMSNKNVFLMHKVEDVLQIGTVPFSTFGEDTTRLYQNIFGYDENDSYFVKVVKRLHKEQELNYNEIITVLEKKLSLSFNAKLMIRDICS